jgi:MFS transporter, VNT family, synaptic vesicle glycoprotein 2
MHLVVVCSNVTMNEKNFVSLEEVIKKCGFGKFNYILIILAGGLMGVAFIELTSVNFILSVAQCDLNMTTSDKGLLSSIGYVGVILSSHLWGFLSDTKGRRKTLIASLLVAFVATLFSSFVNSFILLVFLRFVNGFL